MSPHRTRHALAKKRRPSRPNQRPKPSGDSNSVALTPTPAGDGWILRHPRCARDRAEDIEEVGIMIDAGELEVARDELQWLLSGCTDCLDAHLLLGQLALDGQNDYELARGHFGYAYQLGFRAWRRAGEPTPVRYSQLPNRGFFEAGRALAWCLEKLNKRIMADEVVDVLVKLDPDDPLGCRRMLAELRDTGSLPML